MEGLAHLINFLIVAGIIVALGFLTAGWMMRVTGWAWLALAFILVITASTASSPVGTIIAALACWSIAFVFWGSGHWVHAKMKGWWKSALAFWFYDQGRQMRMVWQILRHGAPAP